MVNGKAVSMYRVLFHLDDCAEAQIRLTLENISALIEEAGKGAVEIELLANGAGVLSLIRAPNPARGTVERLSLQGVRLLHADEV